MSKKLPIEIEVGVTVRRRFGGTRQERSEQTGTVLALGRKYRGARPHPAAKVQLTSRVLWYFLDQLEAIPSESVPSEAGAKD